MQKKVSIVTPCYNAEKYLDSYFKSILLQTYKNLELILVNDGSQDNTKEKFLEWEPILKEAGIDFKHFEKQNGGAASAINIGLNHISGDYFTWPDVDDLMTYDSIEKRVTFLEANPSFGLVRSDANVVSANSPHKVLSRLSGINRNRFSSKIFDDLIRETTYCIPGCYMIRTHVLRECIPSLKIYETHAGQNWQILLPVTYKHEIGFIDEPLFVYYIRPNSHSRLVNQSYAAQCERMEMHKDVLNTVISQIDLDQEYYAQMVDLKYIYRRFALALRFGEKTFAQKEYFNLMKYDKATFYDQILLSACGTGLVVRGLLFIRRKFKEIMPRGVFLCW